jgi:hypothetical protein
MDSDSFSLTEPEIDNLRTSTSKGRTATFSEAMWFLSTDKSLSTRLLIDFKEWANQIRVVRVGTWGVYSDLFDFYVTYYSQQLP